MSYSRLIGHGATVDPQNNLLVIPLSSFLLAYNLMGVEDAAWQHFINGYLAGNPDAHFFAFPTNSDNLQVAKNKASSKGATILIYNDYKHSL